MKEPIVGSRAVIVLIVMLGLACAQGNSQTFTFVTADTARSGLLGSEIVFDVTITNTSAITLTLGIARSVNQLPDGWESSMCLNVCYPSTTDSVFTTPAFGSSPLAPGESRPFSVHVYTTTTNGTGIVTIVARNTRDANDVRVTTFHATSIPVSVTGDPVLPTATTLSQNYPNPFNPTTTFQITVGKTEWISLRVFDIMGKEVATLVEGVMQPGTHTIPFDGNALSSGTYFYRLTSENHTSTGRMLLLR
jgi:hypothetical protein